MLNEVAADPRVEAISHALNGIFPSRFERDAAEVAAEAALASLEELLRHDPYVLIASLNGQVYDWRRIAESLGYVEGDA